MIRPPRARRENQHFDPAPGRPHWFGGRIGAGGRRSSDRGVFLDLVGGGGDQGDELSRRQSLRPDRREGSPETLGRKVDRLPKTPHPPVFLKQKPSHPKKPA